MKLEAMPMNCERALALMDSYLDRELPDPADVGTHLESCAACRRELGARQLQRERLRSAVRAITASPELRARIERSLAPASPRPRANFVWAAAVAALLVLCSGSFLAYQRGHFRFTRGSQDSYFVSLAQHVSGVMSVGLGDHVHCAFFRKYPAGAPSPEQIAKDLGPEYADLLPVVRDHLPANQKVVMAHRCSYRGRKFTHIAMADGTHLASLVIADRRPGEDFSTSGLAPALSDSGLPLYRASVQRFQISGMQTEKHLVYLVSDLPEQINGEMFAALAPQVGKFLVKLES